MKIRMALQSIAAKTLFACAVLQISIVTAAEPWARIEEDWELVIGPPSPSTHSPQVSIYLMPDSERPETYFQIQLNHAADDGFLGGGFRVAAVQNGVVEDFAISETRERFTYQGDTIAWTNVMAIAKEELLFAIKNGTSESWGEFGGPEYLLRVKHQDINDFKNYNPQQSVADVDFGYGRNRIESLKLVRVRAYRANGTFFTVNLNESDQ